MSRCRAPSVPRIVGADPVSSGARRRRPGPTGWLADLERTRVLYGAGAAVRKRELLVALAGARLERARDILRLHDALCFLRAYPDDQEVLAQVVRMLKEFDRRPDLMRHTLALENSGVAGTAIRFRFFDPTAHWLEARWPKLLRIDWPTFEQAQRVQNLLPLFAAFAESPALDELDHGVRDWIDRLRGPAETDAAFLIAGFRRAFSSAEAREKIWDELDAPIVLQPGPGTPARGREWLSGAPQAFQRVPLDHSRPNLATEALRLPLAVRRLSRRRGQQVVDLARACMVTRSRDLDAFSYGDPRDVQLIDCGGGLAFACIGVIPERRLLLDAVYGYLTLRNGVPIGYVLTSALFGSAEVAYNVFEPWRGAEAGRIYASVIGMVRHLFGVDSFTIVPFQLGEDNDEAIRSGAWWFYQKMGFRVRDPAGRSLARRELTRARKNPRYRSSSAVLRRLARHNLFWHLGQPREDVIGVLPLAQVGAAVTRRLTARHGRDRTAAEDACAREAQALLATDAPRGWSSNEALAWRRWSPLVTILPGVSGWTADEKSTLVEVIRAKGGVRESDFVTRFDTHSKLRGAIRALAHESDRSSSCDSGVHDHGTPDTRPDFS